ncbi:hypothetical protein D3C79_636340 [compost metagenome]
MHQGQYTAVQGQTDAVIRVAGITVPDIVQQGQGHGTVGRIDGQGEVVHPVGAAGDDVANLAEQDLSALTIGSQRIDCIEAAGHTAATKRQAVTNTARSIRPIGVAELGLHRGGCQGRVGDTIVVCPPQSRQALIHLHHPEARSFVRQADSRAIILETEGPVDPEIQTGLGAVTIGIGHGLHQGQHTALQSQTNAVIRVAGIAVPDIVQQRQCHRSRSGIYGQGEVAHPIGTAGDDVTHLVEQDLGPLTIGHRWVNRIESTRHIAAIERQAVTNAASAIRAIGRVELGLYGRPCQGRAGDPIVVRTAQCGQAFIHDSDQTRYLTRQTRCRAVIFETEGPVDTQIQAGLGTVTVGIGDGLHQRQCSALQGQADAVIRVTGISMPEVIQQGQGHGACTWIYGQGEVTHSIGAAGYDVTNLIEQDLGALPIDCQRIDSIETARQVAAIELQAVTDAASPIRTVGMAELGLHRGCRQGGARNTIAAHPP